MKKPTGSSLPTKEELERLAEKIKSLVKQDPGKAARLLTELSKRPAESKQGSESTNPKTKVIKKSA